MNNLPTGKSGEDIACKYLQDLGYKILDRNFRIRGGEIDIIAKDHDQIVFVEVKTRYSHEFGTPLEAITPWKIKFLIKTAQFYLAKKQWLDRAYRLDALSVDFTDGIEIDHIKNITL